MDTISKVALLDPMQKTSCRARHIRGGVAGGCRPWEAVKVVGNGRGGGERKKIWVCLSIMAYFKEFALCSGMFQRKNFVVTYFKSENSAMACT